ncbi:MAG: DUF4340 domain-containing protein [Lachnospiraceae bacterium]|nr:DUF4340 domain-containing protein [Lachnospiraceae bacterium]
MKSQKKTFAILVIILIVCLGAYFGIRTYNSKTEEKEKKEKEAEEIVVTNMNADDITAFSYAYEDNQLSFSKQGDNWVCDNDTAFTLNQDAIETMLLTLKDLKAEDSIDVKATEEEGREDYGFSNPTMTIAVETGDKNTTFTFGMHNDLTNQDYMMVNTDQTVYLMATDVKAAFQKSLVDLKATEDLSTESTESE